jgi:hypothetical protein
MFCRVTGGGNPRWWTQHRNRCQTQREGATAIMNLVSVADATENTWIDSTADSVWGSWGEMMIGAARAGGTGGACVDGFIWTANNSATSYRNWRPGEPNCDGGAGASQGSTKLNNGGWNDITQTGAAKDEAACEWRNENGGAR